MKNTEIIDRLLTLGKIPNDSEMTDEQFKKYDCLLAMFEEDLSFEEAEQMMPLFSDECDDLNWFLLHAIESVPHIEVENYKKLIAKCPNDVKPHFIPDDFCKLFQSKSPVIKCGNDNDSKLFQS